MTVTPDAPRPDLDEADPLHVLSRESQTRAIAYTAATPKERHVLFGLLLADYDQQAAELDRLRAIEQRARERTKHYVLDRDARIARYILGEA